MSTFTFVKYAFDAASKKLELHYQVDEQPFTETYTFNIPSAIGYDPIALDRALQNLFFMAGVSYFKTKVPDQIEVKAGQLDSASAAFFSETWQKGLGEFFYVNQLDPRTPIVFPSTSADREQLAHSGSGKLVAVGGGKDSLVSIELLRDQGDITTWSLDHQSQLTPLVETIGLPHVWVERVIDPRLLELNKQPGIYNGHVPISAIFACVGTIVAILTGKRDVVMSNESSADEPTLTYQGVAINHQYSKSSEFERAYQAQLERDFGSSVRYYSFLRPLSELAIAEAFARVGLGKYGEVFSSCNRAFTQDQTHLSWCGTCPKCAFTFLALSPFVGHQQLERLFGGRNLLKDPALVATYNQLLGIEGDKPLECVGEVRESRAAMRLAQEHIPELSHYDFELPAGYDFRQLGPDAMPAEIRQVLNQALDEV